MLKNINFRKAVSAALLTTLISPFFVRPHYSYANSSNKNSLTAMNAGPSESIDELLNPQIVSPQLLPETVVMPDIDYTYITDGKPRVLNRDDFKDLKQYFSDEEFESIFAPRNDFYIVIHTTEQCQIKQVKTVTKVKKHKKPKVKYVATEVCSTVPNLIDDLKKNKKTHFFIDDACKTHAIVGADYLANAVGETLWNGTYALNVNSISIEVYANVENKISGTHEIPISDCQYAELGKLVKYLQQLKSVPDENVLGHNQVGFSYKYKTRQRKGDPGKNFDWSRIGMPNNYLLVDRDLLSGRAINDSDAKTIELRVLPSQMCAEQYAKKNIGVTDIYFPMSLNDSLSCKVSNKSTVKNNF